MNFVNASSKIPTKDSNMSSLSEKDASTAVVGAGEKTDKETLDSLIGGFMVQVTRDNKFKEKELSKLKAERVRLENLFKSERAKNEMLRSYLSTSQYFDISEFWNVEDEVA